MVALVLSLVATRRRSLVFAGLFTAALVAALIGGLQVSPADVDGFGLVSAMPVIYWVGAALAIIASFMVGFDAVKGGQLVGFQLTPRTGIGKTEPRACNRFLWTSGDNQSSSVIHD